MNDRILIGIEYGMVALAAGLIGYYSPWPLTDWHYWLIVAPACIGIGLLARKWTLI
jgi:hypothetical protein